MKKYFVIIFLLFVCIEASAHHLKGGWIFYHYVGAGSAPNTSRYQITVKQYLNCESTPQQIDPQVYLGIFDASNNQSFTTITIPLGNQTTERLDINTLNPCINPKPIPNDVCYLIDTYTTTVDLPNNTAGYVLAVQRCCRIDDIANVQDDPVNGVGVTYTTTIPGVVNGVIVRDNNSPIFAQNDVTVICINSPFTFDFSATDVDNDSLSYTFCPGLTGGDLVDPQPTQPSNPPFEPIKYSNGFSAGAPLGDKVTIDSHTGLISGTAPSLPGTYVVAVCALEYRNGVFIDSTKKEIHINVANCSLNAAQLKPSYITCDGYSFTFHNESTNTNINSYLWDFGVPGITSDTSSQPTPTYTYADTGAYIISLHVSNTQGCNDATQSTLYVYPGFVANFGVQGSCYLNQFVFTDSTKTNYGFVNSWRWNFGDNSTLADTSTLQNPFWKYSGADTTLATLIVTNSKGCVDTISKPVNVYAKPVVFVPFTDTLICSKDSLQLFSSLGSGTGVFSWQPGYNIINSNTNNPIVFPKDTTTYIVSVNDKGCINTDSIKVNVIDNVLVDVGPDTTICKTDSIELNASTNALKFLWSPPDYLSNSSIKNPKAAPLNNTTYNLLASVGSCFSNDAINIKVAPYPFANAGSDTSICYGKTVQLKASFTGAFFNWSPTNSLLNANTINPTAGPEATTNYVLTVNDTIGCPKPVSDTIVVNVVPKIQAFAGNDTTIVANEPLQLNASGGSNYIWSPTIGMDNPNINNPVVVLGSSFDSVTYIVKVSVPPGCFAFDSVKVIVFKTNPEIFIPTAFTPNNDGKNDILKPIIVGMKRLAFFKVFNRWGQLLFSTNEAGQGWDGRFAGALQPSGTYVFEAQATDYLGNKIFRKGTVVLIR